MTPAQDQYPHDLAGAPAWPPETPEPDLVAAWRTWEAAEAAELGDGLLTAPGGDWRMAGALETLLAEANVANPRRDRSSDGGIGNARHAALGKGSDHNPWIKAGGVGVVRARDFDTDGLDIAAAFERCRARAFAGELPQLLNGGYLIYAGRITAPDFSGWREYTGENAHVTHGHVSVSREASRFDDRRPWHAWTPAPATAGTAPTTPRNTPPAATRTSAADLRGRAFDVRGEQGARGPRTGELQKFLRRYAPAYAGGLTADGAWGPITSGVLRQFAQRAGIRNADGQNIGPQLARKLYLAGFRG